LWVEGQGGAMGLCLAPEKSSVRRSFVPGLLLRLASGDVVSTAEGSCAEYASSQQPSARPRPTLALVQ
jgi:hypothetical protein